MVAFHFSRHIENMIVNRIGNIKVNCGLMHAVSLSIGTYQFFLFGQEGDLT